MNVLFRHSALLALGILLAMPVITLHGGIHLVLLIVCVALLGKEIFTPGIWQLCALGAYALLIGAFYVSGLDELKEINSQQMRQTSMMLLVFCAMRRVPLPEMHAFLAFVLIVAVAGVIGEMRGSNMHDFLPAKVAQQDYYTDAGFLSSGEQRYRGFFTESSVLLAATTGYAFIAVLGALTLRRQVSGRLFLAASAGVCALCILFLLAVTLAKTGLVLTVGGAVGFLFAVLRYSPRKRLLGLLIGGVAVVLLFAAAVTALPGAKQQYFLNDLRSLRPAMEGNNRLEATTSGGLLTRVECWRIALVTVQQHPLGVGLFGVGDVYSENSHISLTGELKYLFGLGIYGLKNTLANVIAQTGLPGVALLFGSLWQCFVRPLRLAARRGEPLAPGSAGVYLAALGMALLFLATCETYYWMAFFIVLKCYADAVARARAASDAWIMEEIDFDEAEYQPEPGEPAYQ